MASNQVHNRVLKPRQRPVSCTFCRARKLKCDRSFPCSSCVSRSLPCQQNVSSANNSADQNTAILARLKRLEDIVLKNTESEVAGNSDSTAHQEIGNHTDTGTSGQDPDIDQLELIYMTEPSAHYLLPEEIICDICPLSELGQRKNFTLRPDSADLSNVQPYPCIWLPTHKESQSLTDIYLNSTTHMFHVIHVSTVKKLVDDIYKRLASQKSYDAGQVALLLSILATTAYLWSPHELQNGLFATVKEARTQSVPWTKATLDLIDNCCRTAKPTMELIQAMIIISFLVTSMEGFNAKFRTLVATAIALARDLSFHRIDRPGHHQPSQSTESMIYAEVGRRLWWHLAATDWMLSGFGGPLEGVYTVHPKHMNVSKPMNINDDDLQGGLIPKELPRSHPTRMSYILERLRLGELCRETADCEQIPSMNAEGINYNQILEIDSKFKQFLQELPPFFQLDSQFDRSPGIIVQRYVINLLTNSRRCKLHLPFLQRGKPGSLYSHSRDACLEASRQILHSERLLGKEDLSFVSSRMRFSGALQCLCLAIVAFAMDLSFHKSASNYSQRMEDLKDACHVLDEARSQSHVAVKFFDTLMDVLRKHRISLPMKDLHSTEMDNIEQVSVTVDPSMPLEEQQLPVDLSTFDGVWQSFQHELDSDVLDWNSVFEGLDSQIMGG